MNNKKIWMICKVTVLILIILTFTDLITPAGTYKPTFMGLPYTLWVGMVQAILLVSIAWIGTKVHPGRNE